MYTVKLLTASDMTHYRICKTWQDVRRMIDSAPHLQHTIVDVRRTTGLPQHIARVYWGDDQEPR